jgi:hypothetical protein
MVTHYSEAFLAKRTDQSHIQELRKHIRTKVFKSTTLEKPLRYLQTIVEQI